MFIRHAVFLGLFPLLASGCFSIHCGPPSPTGDDFEFWGRKADKIANAVSNSIIKHPPGNEFLRFGARQEVAIEFSILEKDYPGYAVEAEGSLVSIVTPEREKFRLQFGWIGKNCKIRIDGKKMHLSFLNNNERFWQGFYIYTIYGPLDQVWHTFLFNEFYPDPERCDVWVSGDDSLNPCEDIAMLRRYEKSEEISPMKIWQKQVDRWQRKQDKSRANQKDKTKKGAFP